MIVSTGKDLTTHLLAPAAAAAHQGSGRRRARVQNVKRDTTACKRDAIWLNSWAAFCELLAP